MNNEVVQKRKIIKYKHLLFGVIILLSGIFIGFSGGLYMIRSHFDLFRPQPRQLRDNMTTQIIRDYPSISSDKGELNEVIDSKLREYHELNEEISYLIIELQQEIAVEVSHFIKDKKDKERWLHDFPRYFPGRKRRLPRAKRFEERLRCEPDACKIKLWQHKSGFDEDHDGKRYNSRKHP